MTPPGPCASRRGESDPGVAPARSANGFAPERWFIDEPEDRAESKKMLRTAAQVGAVGLEMGIAVAVGYFAGAYVDGKLGTSPTFGLIGLVAGIGAAGNALWRTARKLSKDQDLTQ